MREERARGDGERDRARERPLKVTPALAAFSWDHQKLHEYTPTMLFALVPKENTFKQTFLGGERARFFEEAETATTWGTRVAVFTL